MKHKVYASVKIIGYMLGAGVALALPFVHYRAGWLSLVALLPLLFGLEWLEELKWKRWHKVALLYGVGLVFFGIIVQWMYHIRATDLIADSALRMTFVILSFFLVASSLALGFVAFGWLYFRLPLSLKSAKIFALLPAVWVLGEYVRSVLFSVMWLGPGGSVGPHWNFGNLGFAASVTPLVYGSRLLGLFGLSAVVVTVNLSLYMLIKRRFTRYAISCLLGALILSGLGYGLYVRSVDTKAVKVAVGHIQTGVDTGYEAALARSVAQNSTHTVDVLILPEYSHFFEADAQQARPLQQQIARAALGGDQSKGVIITSRAGTGDYEGGNGVVYVRQNEQVISTQYKRFLIPAGEYVPYVFQAILKLSGNGSVVSAHQTEKTIRASKQGEQAVLVDGVRYGALACSGVIAPEFYRLLTHSGAEVLTNSASLSSMGIDKLYFQEARQMARFQAVANARPFAQAARGGESYVVDKDGAFVAQTHADTTQYLHATVGSNARRTLYSLAGEWVLLIALMIGLGAIVGARRKPAGKASVSKRKKH